jgi:hypothetical protein
MGAASLWPIFKGFETMVSLIRIRPTVVFFFFDEISPKFDLRNLIFLLSYLVCSQIWLII